MKGIDHLVLAGRDLEAMRARYAALGFTLTPHGRHPFGTANSLVQFDRRSFLELLAVAAPGEVPPHAPNQFSFAAFNRDYLARGEGFSMLVLDSADARADVAHFRQKTIPTYEPFDFSRAAALPSGETATVGFSLAFATLKGAPDAGFFCCQQHAPEHFWKPEYQKHRNTARGINEVVMVAGKPAELGPFLETFAGEAPRQIDDGLIFKTARGIISVMAPDAYFHRFRMAPPDLQRGPRFAAYVIGVRDLDPVQACAAEAGVPLVGRKGRYVVAPEYAFGAAIAFEKA
jgi:Glyoxalase-like domain